MRNPITRYLSSLVFPPCCNGCDQQIFAEPNDDDTHAIHNAWCDDCLSQLIAGPLDRCIKCGAFIEHNHYRDRCRVCHNVQLKFDSAIAVNNYQGLVRDLVIRMKRDREDVLAFQFGRLLALQVDKFSPDRRLDKIVPIPSHWIRRCARGFQASGVIADGVASILELPVCNRTLVSRKRTRKQGTLSSAGRITNVRRAFGLHDHADVEGKTILLIDDVMTSGATTSEASKVLIKAGASQIVVGVIARGTRTS